MGTWWAGIPRPGRIVLAVGSVAVVVLGAVVLLLPEDDTVRTADSPTTTGETTTTEPSTTTSSSTTSTTAPTTTEAPTSTAAPTTTAAPPPPAPPATSPPVSSGSLDVAQVLAFAKASKGGTPPYTYTGATMCPAYTARTSDAGDDAVRDIGDWGLGRYCDGTYRGSLSTTSDTPALEAAWIRVDSRAGGCQGTDHVVIGWHEPNPGAAVIATPTCDKGSWSRTDAAGFPVFNGAALQLDFRGSAIGNPSSFRWRGYVKGVGDTTVDVVPNSGPETFEV